MSERFNSSPGNGKKILSLSPTATEMLYAIGAGDQVVAVDSLSNYPAEASDKVTKISAFEPNAADRVLLAVADADPGTSVTAVR